MERNSLIMAIIFTLMGFLVFALIPFQADTLPAREGWLFNVNPRTFPYIMASIMTAMGLFNVFIAGMAYKKALSKNSFKEVKVNISDWKTILILWAIMFLYALFLRRLGYVVCTIAAVISVAFIFKARWWQALLLGFLLSPIIYILFTRVGVPLPRGILPFF